MKILVVDDEYLVRQDLISLINWNSIGFDSVIEAKNGVEGYELFMLNRPSIVITDIKMPLMDGMQMTEKIIKKAPQTKIIVLTAYEEFEYAHSAIRLGVRHFLLKHEIESQKLEKIIRELLAEISESDYSKRIQKEWLFNRFLFEVSEDQEETRNKVRNIYLSADNRKYFALISLSFSNIMIRRQTITENGWKNIISNFNEYLGQMTFESAQVECVLHNEDNFTVIFLVRPVASKAEQQHVLHHLAAEISSKIEEELKIEVFISCGRIEPNVTALKESILKVNKRMERKFLMPRGSIIYYDEKTENPPEDFDFKKLYAGIPDIILNENPDEFFQFIDETYFRIIPVYGDYDTMMNTTRNIIYELKKMTQISSIKGNNQVEEATAILDSAPLYDNIFDISMQLKNAVKLIFEVRRLQADCQYSIIVKRALEYIHENYNNDISLSSLADELEVSNVYISQLFKKETGINYIDYITEYRIEKAKRLLITGKYKINEVCDKVGFKNTQYFSLKFKNIVGVPPIKYKNM